MDGAPGDGFRVWVLLLFSLAYFSLRFPLPIYYQSVNYALEVALSRREKQANDLASLV